PRHSRHPAEDRKGLTRRQVTRETVPLRKIAHALAALRIGHRDPEEMRRATGRPREAEQDLDGGRLTGAVRPQQAENLAGPDRKVDSVERAHASRPETGGVYLREALRLDDGGFHDSLNETGPK